MEKMTDCYVIYHKIMDYGVWNNEIWTPLQVGVENHGKITEYGGCYDNEGDNLSIWNPCFSELTGLYWIWKHLTGKKYAGQVQYRRRFDIQSIEDLDKAFEGHKVIVADPARFRCSLKQQYAACHSPKDIELCEQIVKLMYPDYAEDWDKYINTGGEIHYSNGIIMPEEEFDRYCDWLFSILFQFVGEMGWNTPEDVRDYVEKEIKAGVRRNIDNTGKPDNAVTYQSQVPGFLSERLLTLYVKHNFKPEEIMILPYKKMENCF